MKEFIVIFIMLYAMLKFYRYLNLRHKQRKINLLNLKLARTMESKLIHKYGNKSCLEMYLDCFCK